MGHCVSCEKLEGKGGPCLLCRNLRLREFRRVEIVLNKSVLLFFKTYTVWHWLCCSHYDVPHVATVSNHIQNKDKNKEALRRYLEQIRTRSHAASSGAVGETRSVSKVEEQLRTGRETDTTQVTNPQSFEARRGDQLRRYVLALEGWEDELRKQQVQPR